jgi:hypothetical protein
MARFTQDNTEGYNAADLANLNAAYSAIVNLQSAWFADADEVAAKSQEDHIASKLLARYDIGVRGNNLLNHPDRSF